MKILILTNKPPYPAIDGGSIATLALIRGLSEQGHEVTVLVMNTKKHHISPFELPAELTSTIAFHLVEVPAPISLSGLISNLLFSKLPYNAQRFIAPNYRQKLIALLEKQHFDIVQLEGLYLAPYINDIRNHSKATIAYRAHNIEHEIWERTLLQTKGIRKAYIKILARRIRNFEIAALNRYDLLVPITPRDFVRLNELGNTQPGLALPAGIDEQKELAPFIPSQRELFFIGALDWTPNQEGLLWFLDQCWPLLLDKAPQINLSVAGRNAPEAFVQKIGRPHVHYLGEVKSARDFMLENGIMIAPLFSGSGMRVKIVEGMSLGRVIVTTPIGCEGIEALNGQEILIEDDPVNFSTAILRLLNEPERQIQISKNSFTFVQKNYVNEKLAGKLAGFYQTHIG
ncbi:MAG TPA: glycosyltransferase family 4 protein [Prolixibacteraceae bacterium]|nr:glycosyltransferase family 4 protein [Prolixibacteraceae bacterium]